MREFRCKNCKKTVATQNGDILICATPIHLHLNGFDIPCECGEKFRFDFRKAKKSLKKS